MSLRQIQRLSAYALIVQEGRMLLCRISSLVPDAAGMWTLPGGGLDFGEHPEAGVVREVREETGLDVVVTSVATVDSERFQNENRELHAVRILYHGQVVGGVLTHEAEGSTDRCDWFSPEELTSLRLVPVARLGASLALGIHLDRR